MASSRRIIEGQHGPGARSLILLTILDAAFQFGSHPAYSSVGNNTRGSMAQLSIPDQGSYLTLCTILLSEINNKGHFHRRYEGPLRNTHKCLWCDLPPQGACRTRREARISWHPEHIHHLYHASCPHGPLCAHCGTVPPDGILFLCTSHTPTGKGVVILR